MVGVVILQGRAGQPLIVEIVIQAAVEQLGGRPACSFWASTRIARGRISEVLP
jgi:hypothetical protein